MTHTITRHAALALAVTLALALSACGGAQPPHAPNDTPTNPPSDTLEPPQDPTTPEPEPQPEPQPQPEPEPEPEPEPQPEPEPEPQPEPEPEPSAPHATLNPLHGPYALERVIDGDTIILTLEHGPERIRILLVDTPELSRTTDPHEPYALEATHATQALLHERRDIHLELDINHRDRYGRLLAHVLIPDPHGPWRDPTTNHTYRNLGHELLTAGLGTIMIAQPNVLHLETFRDAERDAREHERGLWSHEPPCIDLNTSTTHELQTLPHIGPERAQHITELRPMQPTHDDLQRIHGIGPARATDIINSGLLCSDHPHP